MFPSTASPKHFCAEDMGIRTLQEIMLQSLERRFAKIDDNKCLVLETLQDPQYKGLF